MKIREGGKERRGGERGNKGKGRGTVLSVKSWITTKGKEKGREVKI